MSDFGRPPVAQATVAPSLSSTRDDSHKPEKTAPVPLVTLPQPLEWAQQAGPSRPMGSAGASAASFPSPSNALGGYHSPHHDPTLAADIENIAAGIRRRDAAINALNNEMALIRRDYEHNYNLAVSLQQENAELKMELAAREAEVASLEGRCAAQSSKIEGSEDDLRRMTAGLQAKTEALAAQLSIMTTERASFERQAADKEMECASLRREVQALHAAQSRAVEAVKQDTMAEAEQQLLQRERTLRAREDTLRREASTYEHAVLELKAEITKAQDERRTALREVEELGRVVAHKEGLVEQLQAQLAEARRASTQQRAALEAENLALIGSRDNVDRAMASQHATLRKELDKRLNEIEVLEAKLAAARGTADAEARRRADERDVQVSAFEDKYRALSEKLRASESREQSLSDEVDRLKRRLQDAKAVTSEVKAQLAAEVERNDALRHSIGDLEGQLRRASLHRTRLEDEVVDLSKTRDMLLAEAGRREWRERNEREIKARLQAAKWNDDEQDSQVKYPMLQNGNATHGEHANSLHSEQQSTLSLLHDIKDALKTPRSTSARETDHVADRAKHRCPSTSSSGSSSESSDSSSRMRRRRGKKRRPDTYRFMEETLRQTERSRASIDVLRRSNAMLAEQLKQNAERAKSSIVLAESNLNNITAGPLDINSQTHDNVTTVDSEPARKSYYHSYRERYGGNEPLYSSESIVRTPGAIHYSDNTTNKSIPYEGKENGGGEEWKGSLTQPRPLPAQTVNNTSSYSNINCDAASPKLSRDNSRGQARIYSSSANGKDQGRPLFDDPQQFYQEEDYKRARKGYEKKSTVSKNSSQHSRSHTYSSARRSGRIIIDDDNLAHDMIGDPNTSQDHHNAMLRNRRKPPFLLGSY